jgi:thiol-disulfide isomerase/thioredoxin
VAPNFVGINAWLNSDPLNIADLRGKVVLVDFWTFACINCIRTLPHVRLYDTYKDKGLVIVGIHTPEFPFEKATSNVQATIKRFGIRYPVAQDNEFSTWKRVSQSILAGAVHHRQGRKDCFRVCRRRPIR